MKLNKFKLTILCLLLISFLFSCKKKDNINPYNSGGSVDSTKGITVSTIGITEIKTIIATVNANVEVDSTKNSITMKGIVWGTSPSPTTSLKTKTEQGINKGNYAGQITDLQSNTKYYVRAYVVDKIGNTIYSNSDSFTTHVGWKMVSSNGMSVVGIRDDGSLWSWGVNSSGELGDGTNVSKNMPTQIGVNNDWKQVCMGYYFDGVNPTDSYVLALKNDGSLWAWGYNRRGGLGLGSVSQANVPTRIGLSTDWKQITMSNSTYSQVSYALKTDGTVWMWGNRDLAIWPITYVKEPIIYNRINQVASISGGSSPRTLGIKNDGSLWSWSDPSTPGVGSNYLLFQIGNSNDWSSSFCGGEAYFGLKKDGSLYAWGFNYGGIFGTGTSSGTYIERDPVPISSINSCKMGIAGQIVKNDGTMWVTGAVVNGSGQLDGSFVYRKVGSLNNWVYISSGGLAIQNNGSLWATGLNSLGQSNYILDNSGYKLID